MQFEKVNPSRKVPQRVMVVVVVVIVIDRSSSGSSR